MKSLAIVFFLVASAFASDRAPVRTSYQTEHFELAAPYTLALEMPRFAAICEQVYDSLRLFYRYELPAEDRFRLVFIDEEDYSNGFAIGFAGWVSVYLAPGDFALRGNPGWHANVLAHEIAHLFSLRKLGYTSRYLGHYSSLTTTRRRGSVAASFGPIPFDEESWLVEGLAQIGAEACGLDRWDAMRDALEREAWFSGELPSMLALKTFHQDSRLAELLYNQGYSFLRWIRLTLEQKGWEQFIDYAATNSLHATVEYSFQKTFTDVFEQWRDSRKVRHQRFQTTFQTIDSQAVEKKDFYQIQGKRVWTKAGIFSLQSSPNDHGALRLYDPHGDILASDPSGLLWANRSGTRMLFGRTEIGTENLHRNTLYEMNPLEGTPKLVAPGSRIYAACVTGGVTWVIHHRNGRNAVGKVVSEAVVEFPGLPSGLEPIELDCQDGDASLVVSATHGSGRALYRVDVLENSLQWIPLAGIPLEDIRNPVLADHGVYFAADYTGAFQIYRMPIQGNHEPEILTHYRGGAFYPSVFPEGLRYSVFQEGSFYSITGVPQGEIARDSFPLEPVFASPLLRLSRTAFQQTFQKADRISYLGWMTSMDFSTGMPDLKDSTSVSGKVWSWTGIGGILFADPALQNMIEIQAGLIGLKHSKVYADKPGYVVGAGWSTTMFAPDFAFQAQLQAVPLAPYGGETFPDSVRDELSRSPWLSLYILEGIMQQPLNQELAVLGQLMYQGIGIQDQKATEGQTVTIIEQAQGLLALTWSDLESGRRHYNSGLAILGGGGFQWMGVVPLYTGISLTMPMLVGQAIFAGNIGRSIYMGLELSASSIYVPTLDMDDAPKTGFHSMADAQASIDVPLPWRTSGLFPGSRYSIAWTNWELHLGYGVQVRDSLMSGSETGLSRISPRMAPSQKFAQRNIAREMAAWTNPEILSHRCDFAFRWETLTIANMLAQWEIGVSVPPNQPQDWMLRIGISL